MGLLITEKPQEVATVLFQALDKLIANRIEDSAFTDEEEVITKGHFSTLEGLEALLIPFVNLPKSLFWDPLHKKYPQLFDLIVEDVNFVLKFNYKKKSPPKEQGIPYFQQRSGAKLIPYWTSECASFTLSVLTNFISFRNKYGLTSSPTDSKIIEVIKTNFDWIKLCKRDYGWAWTNDSPSHPWPTWSLLDTFDEMTECNLLHEMHDTITNEYEEILEKITNSFRKKIAGSYAAEWEQKVIECTPYDVEAALDLLRLMLGISLHNNKKIVKEFASWLFSWAATEDLENVNYSCHLPIKSDYISDSSLVPCLFRTLVVMAGILAPKRIGDLNQNLGQDHEIVINRVYQYLMKCQISKGKYEGLWAVSNAGLTYELYYTERTIESLVEFLLHYDKSKIELPVEEDLEKTPERINEKLISEETPLQRSLSELPSEFVLAYLPVLDEVVRRAKKHKDKDVFSGLIIVYVLHLLRDLPPFLQKFEEFGCSTNDMYLLVKTYDYPEKQQLLPYLQKVGCNAFLPTDKKEKTFYDEAKKMLRECIRRCKQEGKKILIIEDGGYFVPSFYFDEFIQDASLCRGAVEQTTKGHRRDSRVEDLRFPVISEAYSSIKKFVEGQEVADSLHDNVTYILKMQQKPLYKVNALVLGFGAIGSKLADRLRDRKVSVYVYDSDFTKGMEAETLGFTVLENLKSLSNFDIIVGVSGETSLKEGGDFWNLKHNVILVSGSSERVEFDIETLENCSKDVIREGIFTKYRLEKEEKLVRLVLDGEPINFALSGGIMDAIIDPVYAEMFLAAIEIITNRQLDNKLHNIPRQIEEEVYEIFKEFHRT